MKTVDIDVYIKDILQPKRDGWQLGLWVHDSKEDTQKIWGLGTDGWPTHMCYRWPQDNAKEIIDRHKQHDNDGDLSWHRWYFDVGRRLYVKDDDLEEACKKLGIWEIP